MSTWALGLAAILYLIASVGEVMKVHYGMALALFCYAVANVGLIWATIR
jgi:hypothetical protein